MKFELEPDNFPMDEHQDKDSAEFSKERANDHVAAEDSEVTRTIESAPSDVESKERAGNPVGSGDSEKTQIVDSSAIDTQIGSAAREVSKDSVSDRIVDSSAADAQVNGVAMDFSKENANDRLAGGDCGGTRNVDSSTSDVPYGSAGTKVSNETVNDNVESPIVDSAVGDVQVGSGAVEASKEIAGDCVASRDCEKTLITSEASDKTEENGSVLPDVVCDPEVDAKAVTSSTAIENQNVETRVVEGKPVIEKESDSSEEDHTDSIVIRSLDGQTHVASVEDEDFSNVEDSKSSQEPTQLEGRQGSALNSDSGPEKGDNHLKNGGFNQKKTKANVNAADSELSDSHEGHNMETEEQDTDSEEPKTSEPKPAKRAVLRENTGKANAATYELPPDFEGEFEVSDLVWGKVRSHPWWPGQIFDPSDASEKALKYQKKDCFLVAYFGDRTFAWNDASLLKPFRSHFCQAEKQNNSEAFHNAVDCALEEVSRRVEFGLACSCIPQDIYNEIRHQTVENAGISQESCVQSCIEKSLTADSFEPGKLVSYMKAIAQCPTGGVDRLQIAVAKSQLLAYNRLKGYSELPEFQFCGDISEKDESSQIEDKIIADKSTSLKEDEKPSSGQQNVPAQKRSYNKRKHNLKDNPNPKKKERRIGDSWDSVDDGFGSGGKGDNKLLSHSSGKKRRGPDSLADELEGRKPISQAKASPISAPKPSFKIGECIRRVASKMTGSPSILKSKPPKIDDSNDALVAEGSDISVHDSEDAEMKTTVPTEYSSLDELLVQLHLAAQDPLKGYNFLTVIVSFFSDFRDTAIMEQREKVLAERRQQLTGDTPEETFEFDDMNDTYWTDRVIQNGSEEHASGDPDKPKSKSRKRNPDENDSGNPDKPKSKSRKRNSDENDSGNRDKPKSKSRKRNSDENGSGNPDKPKSKSRKRNSDENDSGNPDKPKSKSRKRNSDENDSGNPDKPKSKSRKRNSDENDGGNPDKPKSNSRKRKSDENDGKQNADENDSVVAEKPEGYVDENSPAELVMHFPVADSVPSETRLIKMFKQFGPLKEIETEIDRDTNRARVVFKKSCDAEAAHGSATKFNIFGSVLVNYQLNYAITMPFKSEPPPAVQGEDDATDFLQF